MKGKVVLVAAMIAFIFLITRPAPADFSVVYPDQSLGFEINLGGGPGLHAAAFWDIPGDFDIFTFQANAAGNPALAPVLGPFIPAAVAYWLDFRGTDGLGRFIFDVWASQGSGFFFAMTIVF